jgi:hypothetical protein
MHAARAEYAPAEKPLTAIRVESRVIDSGRILSNCALVMNWNKFFASSI